MICPLSFDQAILNKTVANTVNVAVRHCRIGKVIPKHRQRPVIPAMPYVGDFPHYPPATQPIWTPTTARHGAWWQNPITTTC